MKIVGFRLISVRAAKPFWHFWFVEIRNHATWLIYYFQAFALKKISKIKKIKEFHLQINYGIRTLQIPTSYLNYKKFGVFFTLNFFTKISELFCCSILIQTKTEKKIIFPFLRHKQNDISNEFYFLLVIPLLIRKENSLLCHGRQYHQANNHRSLTIS